ncbi:MAG: hypothetical protein JRJ31_11595 [Deltaproteobacteria bacterium]|nr:hypothetical protein [Deltaproteobacteria bacterium]
MFSLYGYRKKGLPYGLIKLHESLLEDTIAYFEKGKTARRKIKEARKAVKQALKLARKKKINPGIKIGRAREVLLELLEEVEYTRKVLRAAAEQMENAIDRIRDERVGEVLALIDDARECFREKEIGKGMDRLKETQERLKKKVLERSRTALLGGIDGEVKTLKYELEQRRSTKTSVQ